MISVLILTKNEAADLPDAIASVSWSDDIHVFDSISTDGTQQIARSLGAHVTERPFDTYSAQRNAAFAMLDFRHEWIFILDADERSTPELNREMIAAAANAAEEIGGFRLQRRDFLWNTWLKHAQITPFYIRLVRRGRAQYIREVNELLEVSGKIGELSSPLYHYPFSKGIAHWVDKHNIYSSMEAALLVSGKSTEKASLQEALFEKDFQGKRAAQKAIFLKLPLRPFLKWFYMMFWRGALLDGSAGIAYATLQSFYEYLIELKRREIVQNQRLDKS